MSHRGQAHARRRVLSAAWRDDDPAVGLSLVQDFDDVRYDDVMPRAHRLRGTMVIDDDGEPAGLNDLRAERRLT